MVDHPAPRRTTWNISFNFVEGESLIMGIKGIAVSSARPAPRQAWSPAMLRALGRSDELPTAACA